MLFTAQDGHWMTGPILIFRGIHAIFGTGSYWPYLIPTMACHLGIVVLVRQLMLRVGVAQWTATILAGMLAVFGSGWENIVFAIQLDVQPVAAGVPRAPLPHRSRRSAEPTRRLRRASPVSSPCRRRGSDRSSSSGR